VLPHARVALGADGGIRIGGASLFRGYFPERREAEEDFATEDLGEFDARGHLHVLGRRDAMIITGGEKVNPTEVEEALRATGEFEDVAVIGAPDADWGAVVVACYPEGERAPKVQAVKRALGAKLAGFKRPKRYVAIAEWPRDARGKLDRAKLLTAVLGA
jgi:O-succinylbenzoic acid--CoA ligase